VKPGLVKNVPGWQLQLHPSLAGGTSPRFGTASQQQAVPGEKMAQVTSITATRVNANFQLASMLPMPFMLSSASLLVYLLWSLVQGGKETAAADPVLEESI